MKGKLFVILGLLVVVCLVAGWFFWPTTGQTVSVNVPPKPSLSWPFANGWLIVCAVVGTFVFWGIATLDAKFGFVLSFLAHHDRVNPSPIRALILLILIGGLGALWMYLVDIGIAPKTIHSNGGFIEMSVEENETFTITSPATVFGESSGQMQLVGLHHTQPPAVKTMPRLNWPNDVDYYVLSQALEPDTYTCTHVGAARMGEESLEAIRLFGVDSAVVTYPLPDKLSAGGMWAFMWLLCSIIVTMLIYIQPVRKN